VEVPPEVGGAPVTPLAPLPPPEPAPKRTPTVSYEWLRLPQIEAAQADRSSTTREFDSHTDSSLAVGIVDISLGATLVPMGFLLGSAAGPRRFHSR
jgi:hypothetical protein